MPHMLKRTATALAAASALNIASLAGGDTNAITATYDNVTFALTEEDLTDGPGSDLSDGKVLPGSFTLDVTLVDEQNPWQIDVSLGSATLPETLQVFTRVIVAGQPVNTTLEGGSDWLLLSKAPQILCTGKGSTAGIGLEMMLGNLSLENCQPTHVNYDQYVSFALGAP